MNAHETIEAIDGLIEWPDEPSDEPKDVMAALIADAEAAILAGAANGTDPRVLLGVFFLSGVATRPLVSDEWVEATLKAAPTFPYREIAKRVTCGLRASAKAIEAAKPQIERLLASAAMPEGRVS